ncbi:MAG: UDP-2,3-diacylglucosamine diphosphatase [Actinobacteria bacterium]|nr:UDP-2,3-diacylglucosamine diphosphatase [Actinomycetota bacterium]
MILVFSDLHLDYATEAERKDLFSLIDSLKDQLRILVLNGDIFDSPSREKSVSEQVENLVRTILSLVENEVSVYYIVGNHDIGMNAFRGSYFNGKFFVAYPSVTITNGNLKFYFEHGHNYDPLFKYSIYDLMEILEKKGNFKFGDLAENLLNAVFSHFQTKQTDVFGVPEVLGKIWKEASENILQVGKYDVVVFGHTHHAEILSIFENKFYVNLGSWFKNQNYLLIDKNILQLNTFSSGKHLTISEVKLQTEEAV